MQGRVGSFIGAAPFGYELYQLRVERWRIRPKAVLKCGGTRAINLAER
jgi:hypothetical protein